MPNEIKAEQWLKEMTLEEKIALLAGKNFWETVPIPRLGIPAIKVTDGPGGARGSGPLVGSKVTSASFPVGIALASSWDTELIAEVAAALAEEVQSKGSQILLAPTVNIHRSPLNGRNFECYSEDPHLTSRMAVAYIGGLQSKNIGATIKHFIANDSEFQRNSISSEVDERTLREIYLPPFEAAVKEANTWAVMSSYNKLNGTHMDGHAEMLNNILKKEWGFDGIVMSDWGGTNSTNDAANHGLDLEMPGPANWRGEKLLKAVQANEVSTNAIDESVRRMLRVILRSGVNEQKITEPEQAIDNPAHRAIIRKAASHSMVLLKNNNAALPLAANKIKSIAIIGPNAKTAQVTGGGSAQVSAHYLVTPLEGIQDAVGANTEISYELGCTNHKTLPRISTELTKTKDGANGFLVEYFGNFNFESPSIHSETIKLSEVMNFGEFAPNISPAEYSTRMQTTLVPEVSGTHKFSLYSTGKSRLLINGKQVLDNWQAYQRGESYFGFGSSEVTGEIEMIAGQNYQLQLEYSNQGSIMLGAFRLGYLPPIATDAIERAADLAAKSEVALVFVGTNGDWESEGHDRADMELPGKQNELVAAVAAANKNTIVILQTGSPVTMPWLNDVAAVLQAWFPGQECGNSIADVVFGSVNPSGKLTQTTPKRIEDNPAYVNYPGENGRVRYGEGIFVGYRYYEKKQVEPLFPFGYGLSYTTFTYNNLKLGSTSLGTTDSLSLSIDISNTGKVAGQEIVQVYIRDVQSLVARPPKELKAFQKVLLEPGQSKTISFTLSQRDFAFWDDGKHAWVSEAGEFEVLVGAASNDIRAQAKFTLNETSELN